MDCYYGCVPMIVTRGSEIIKEEYGISVKITNDNTKNLKHVTVHVRSDDDWDGVLTKALELYNEAIKEELPSTSGEVKEG